MDRLTPKEPYVKPGVYIGQRFTPQQTNVNPETRVATLVGRGSRYIRARDEKVVRGFVYNAELEFSSSAPHVAPLTPASNGDTRTAVLVDEDGIEVRKDLWLLVEDNTSVQIADSIFNPNVRYFFNYQSNDRSVPDPLPLEDARLLEAIGSQVSQDQYKRNKDYWIDTEVLAPVAAVDNDGNVIQHTNDEPIFSDVSHVGTGTAVVALSASALYNHKYSRDFSLEVVSVSGSVVTFEWSSNPLSYGNDADPMIPLSRGATRPGFEIDLANAQSMTVDLRYGLRLDFGTGTYVVGDKYEFVVEGPSLIEVSGALSNTNQFAEATSVILGENNQGQGSIVPNAENYALGSNLKVVLEVLDVDTGVTNAAVPHGEVSFLGNPVDGQALVISNGQLGSNLVRNTFEFTQDAGQRIPGSSLVSMQTFAAVAATGSIEFLGAANQAPVDGATVTLTDGRRTVTFEFDDNAVLLDSRNVRVLISGTAGQQSALTMANLITAINSSQLAITAVDATANGVGKADLTMSIPGSLGNNNIVTNASMFIKVDGFRNGADVSANTNNTAQDFANKVNDSFPRLGILAEAEGSVVTLIHGTRIVFTAQPTDGDTITVTSHGSSVVFEFDNNATVSGANQPVVIGANLAATLANLATAIRTIPNTLAVSSTQGQNTVTVASRLFRSVSIAESSAVATVVADIVTANGFNNGNANIISYDGVIANVSYQGMTGGVKSGDAPDVVTFGWGVAGDVFAGGVLVVSEDKTNDISIYGGMKFSTSHNLARYAKGAINFLAVPSVGDTVVIDDKINAITTLTFVASATLPTEVTIVSGNVAQTCTNLFNKIRALGLAVNFTKPTATSIQIEHTRSGSVYNGGLSATGSAISIVNLTNGGNNYVVGDTFVFTALAPRKFSTALDNREVRMTVGAVGFNSPALVDEKYVMLGYTSTTPEGGFGTIKSYGASKNYFTLPGQIELVLRNPTRFVVGDSFNVEFVNNNVIRWDLDKVSTDTVTFSSVLIDRNGAITGKAGNFYINLKNVPYAGTIKAVQDSKPFTKFTAIPNKNIILLAIESPTEITKLSFTYKHRGSEPNLGSTYYVSAQYLRPKAMYNVPQVFYNRSTTRDFLEPVTLNNDLAIAAELAWSQAPAPVAVAVVQIEDEDDDGVFSPTDIDRAIEGCLGVNYITDVAPINLANYHDKFMAYNVIANDPFTRKEHLCYYGMPIGTPVGSGIDEGSLIFTATKTFAVFGESPAHGTRILVAPTRARAKVTTWDGSVVTAILDGSFVAAAVCAKVAGSNNSTTILKQNLFGFDYIETYSEPVEKLLGGASIIYFSPNGNGIYQIQEDVTTDTSAEDVNNILAMKTKHDSVRVTRRGLDATVVGYVPETKAAGIGFVKSNIITNIMGQIGSGLIAPYQDENGNARQPSQEDVQVIRDEIDKALYHFRYLIFTRSPIKRVYGVYSVNESKLFGSL